MHAQDRRSPAKKRAEDVRPLLVETHFAKLACARDRTNTQRCPRRPPGDGDAREPTRPRPYGHPAQWRERRSSRHGRRAREPARGVRVRKAARPDLASLGVHRPSCPFRHRLNRASARCRKACRPCGRTRREAPPEGRCRDTPRCRRPERPYRSPESRPPLANGFADGGHPGRRP